MRQKDYYCNLYRTWSLAYSMTALMAAWPLLAVLWSDIGVQIFTKRAAD